MRQPYLTPVLALIVGCLHAGHLVAQEEFDPEQILSDYACQLETPEAGCSGLSEIGWIWTHADEVPEGTTSELLDGLETMAVTEGRPQIQHNAMQQIFSFEKLNPTTNVFPRALRIYRSTNDRTLRYGILLGLSNVMDRQSAVGFLTDIAKQEPGKEDFPGAAEAAVRSLALAGPMGAEALRKLDRNNSVKDPRARGLLRGVSRDGYQIPGRIPQ